MQENRVVSIAGRRVGDLAFYLAKIMAASDEPVLIVDLSEQHEIYNTVGRGPGEETGYLRNITIIADAVYAEETFQSFSGIVVYHGVCADDGWWNASDVHFVISNYDRFDVADLARGLNGLDLSDVRMVFKQRFTKKIKDADVIEMLGMNKENLKDMLEIPFDETSEAIHLAWEYNGNQRVADIPKTDLEFLMEMYEAIVPDLDAKEKKKLITLAR